MSKNVHASGITKHPLMQELRNAFSHIDAVEQAFVTNNHEFFLGSSTDDLIDGSISFEEYFCRNILKKVVNIEIPGVDPKAAALDSFLSLLNRQDEDVHRVAYILENVDTSTSVGRVLLRARKELHKLLEDFTGYDVRPRYTGGSTTDLTKLKGANPFNRAKSSAGWDHIDSALKAYYQKYTMSDGILLSDMMPGHGDPGIPFTFVDFVDKIWKTNRVIGRQLIVPLALQVGVGDWLATRATRVGLHIATAQEIHKDIARLSSLFDDHLMTLDQSNASDNILRVLIKFLTPERFFDYIDCITPRAISFKQDGSDLRNIHMMATAGNGYIFPLQTIVFWALAKATCLECRVPVDVKSYGDDLIAPKAIYEPLCIVFDALGLQVNRDKTFFTGHFRESCGGDYLYGSNVRPLYIKELPYDTLSWIRCINGIRRVGRDNNLGHWRTNSFRRLWNWCVSHIPANERLFAPLHYGDSAIGDERERLYRLSFNRFYTVAGTKTKYPNNGLHPSGHPYSGWYIETYARKSSGKGVSFGETIKGVKAEIQLRLVALDAVKGSGLRWRKVWFDDKNVKLERPLLKLGYLPFFEHNEYSISRIRTPLFLSPPAPDEDVPALFEHLGSDNQLYDTDRVVHDCKLRHDNAIRRLVELLSHRVSTLETYIARANVMTMDF